MIQARKKNLDSSRIKELLQATSWGLSADDPWLEILGIKSDDFWHVLDLDGNGKDEWIVSIKFNDYACGSIGELWIIDEKGRVFRWGPKELDGSWAMPFVVGEADMTGDGLPDLVTVSNDCPWHTVTGMYHILSFQSGKITNVVSPNWRLEKLAGVVRFPNSIDSSYNEWPSPGVSMTMPKHTIEDVTGDEISDLQLQGGTYLSREAGLVQGRQEVWAWNGKTIGLKSVTWEKSNERFHVLFDANSAFAFEKLDPATSLYEQVINDPNLKNQIGDDSEQENLNSARQFAAFRLALISLMRADPDGAENWQSWFHIHYPEAKMTEAVDLLIETWQRTKDLPESCSKIARKYRASASGTPHTFGELDVLTGSLTYSGYGNPQLVVEDVCPLK